MGLLITELRKPALNHLSLAQFTAMGYRQPFPHFTPLLRGRNIRKQGLHGDARSAPGPRESQKLAAKLLTQPKPLTLLSRGPGLGALSSVQRTARPWATSRPSPHALSTCPRSARWARDPGTFKALLQTQGDHGQPSPLYGPQAPTL